jgi:hypothetical protein
MDIQQSATAIHIGGQHPLTPYIRIINWLEISSLMNLIKITIKRLAEVVYLRSKGQFMDLIMIAFYIGFNRLQRAGVISGGEALSLGFIVLSEGIPAQQSIDNQA